MIKVYAFILLISCHLATAQTNYTYDGAGNRINRLKESGPLPVTLISFTALKEGSTALLNWQTSLEINADHFGVERSQDGKKWLNIGSIKANGDKSYSSYYSYIDKAPMDGENLYRLKMIDKDGSSAYSQIRSLNFAPQISFYPNPVKDLLKIKGAAQGKVQLFNVSGVPVLILNNIPANGIDMSSLSIGVYMVKILLKDGFSTTKKVVKE